MLTTGEKNINVLWQHFYSGKKDSFSLIYQQTIHGLILYGLKFTPDRDLVQDCIQEVFIELYSMKKKSSRNIKNLKPYLFVAVRNGIFKRLSKESKTRSISEEEITSSLEFNVDYSDEYKYIKEEQNKEIQKRLKEAVSTLAPKQKEIVYLKFEEELDYSDIALIMNISVESARKSVYRAILSLRKILEYA